MDGDDNLECLPDQNEIEKRKPKPFRYVDDLDNESDNFDNEITHSLMTDVGETSEKLKESFDSVVGIGNINAIESVLKKHEVRRGIIKK